MFYPNSTYGCFSFYHDTEDTFGIFKHYPPNYCMITMCAF